MKTIKIKLLKILISLFLILTYSESFSQLRVPLKNAFLQTDLSGNGKDILNLNNLTANGNINVFNSYVENMFATNVFIESMLATNLFVEKLYIKNVTNSIVFASSNGLVTNNVGLLQTSNFTNAVAARIPIVLDGKTYYITLSTNVP